MKVSIIEVETEKLVACYVVNLRGLNYTPSEEEYFSEAWRCAVDDAIVDADCRSKYSYRLRAK